MYSSVDEVREALGKLEGFKERATNLAAGGPRQFNPGWHLALDLRNMLAVCECVGKAALLREESRGGHTRDDFPKMSSQWRMKNLVCTQNRDGSIDVVEQPMPPMRPDLDVDVDEDSDSPDNDVDLGGDDDLGVATGDDDDGACAACARPPPPLPVRLRHAAGAADAEPGQPRPRHRQPARLPSACSSKARARRPLLNPRR